MPHTLEITELGGLGDGVARQSERRVFVPYTCPGDVIHVEHISSEGGTSRAVLHEIITPSPHRQQPPCIHFGTCGGCSLQHISPANYREFKQGIVKQLIQRLQVAPHVDALIEVGAASRRRALFTLQLRKGVVSIGFAKARSHQLVALHMCPVMEDSITAVLPALASCLESLRKPGVFQAAQLTSLENGLDVMLHAKARPSPADREVLKTFAAAYPLSRLSVQTGEAGTNHEILCLHGTDNAAIQFGAYEIALPPGAFLQASSAAQEHITARVLQHTQDARHIADLYAGCGTYSLPLLDTAQHVAAYEGNEAMVQALASTARKAACADRLTATLRDLYTHPLSVDELAPFDSIVINPPRNGALPQVKALASSTVKRIVMVSCNPATFERDARALLHGGYQLTHITPVDQFTWSGHLELVGLFTREGSAHQP